MQKPKMILGDEPVASLDPVTARSILARPRLDRLRRAAGGRVTDDVLAEIYPLDAVGV